MKSFRKTTILTVGLVLCGFLLAPLCFVQAQQQEKQMARQGNSDDLSLHLSNMSKAYLSDQLQILVSGDMESTLNTSKFGAAHRSVIQERGKEILERRELMAKHHQSYTDFQTELTATGFRSTGKIAVMRATEYTVLKLAVADNDPLAPTVTEYAQDHILTFSFEDGEWKLVSDRLLNTPGPTELDKNSTPIHSTPSELAVGLDDTQDTTPNELLTYAAADTINRSAMVDYAYTYWRNYNSSYRNYNNSGTRGGDCTNFVSQVCRAGGWTDVTGFYRDTTAWWYNYFNQSWPWINAHYWAVFTYNRPRATLLGNVLDLVPGDILQVDFDKDGQIDHSTVITRKDSNRTIYVTYHSTDTKDKSIWDFHSTAGNPNYYAWRLNSYIY